MLTLRVPIQCLGVSMAVGIEFGLMPLGKNLPLALKALLKVFDGSDAQFEAGSEVLWLGNATASELEQGYEPAFFGQKDLKPGLEFCVFDDGFLAD